VSDICVQSERVVRRAIFGVQEHTAYSIQLTMEEFAESERAPSCSPGAQSSSAAIAATAATAAGQSMVTATATAGLESMQSMVIKKRARIEEADDSDEGREEREEREAFSPPKSELEARARKDLLQFLANNNKQVGVICHMSYVICHMSYVICHMSYVIRHMSYVIVLNRIQHTAYIILYYSI
jgi:hypothetical protein